MRDLKTSASPSVTQIAFASFIGTAIEFYDFYIYAMAAALVIGEVFFPATSPAAQSMSALLTFGLAFVARPVGAVVFGHFGDKYGRKSTLATSLLVMGGSTLMIGVLPDYQSIGLWAPVLLCVLRIGQGIGLGGEWAGAALLATEYAPEGKRGWYGMFPQLGPSVGFLCATLTFLLLSLTLSETEFKAWGWRVPFIASAALVMVGVFVRVKLAETPVFAQALKQQPPHRWPWRNLLRGHGRALLLGALAMAVCYQLFYNATVFCLNYGTQTMHIAKTDFLLMLCVAVTAMALATPVAAWCADKLEGAFVMMGGCFLTILLGGVMAPLLESSQPWLITLFLFMALGLMGIIFAPMGAFLPAQFPVAVRYSGAGLAYQLGGVLGGSFSPLISQVLVNKGGLMYVGGYLSVIAGISLLAIWRLREL